MEEALAEARKAAAEGEVPIGAVVVHDSRVIGRGRNARETRRDPTAHAEVLALQEAARALGRWRLAGATVYATLEPCPMCAGALVNARVDRLVYAVPDPKAGAAGTLFDGALYNDGWEDASWDGVWDGKARRDTLGWTVEMRIPYSQMRFQNAERWGINFRRVIQRRSEEDFVVFTP